MHVLDAQSIQFYFIGGCHTALGKSSWTFFRKCQIFNLIFQDRHKNLAYCNVISFMQFTNF